MPISTTPMAMGSRSSIFTKNQLPLAPWRRAPPRGAKIKTFGLDVLLNEQWRMPDVGDRSSTPTRRKGGDSESLRKRGGSKNVWSRAGGGAFGVQRQAPDHTEDSWRERISGLCDCDDEGDHPRNVLVDEFDLRNEWRQ